MASERKENSTVSTSEKPQFNIELPSKIAAVIFSVGFGFIVTEKIYKFQTLEYFMKVKTGRIEDLQLGIGYAVMLSIINYMVIFFLKDKMEPLIRTDKYKEPEKRKLRYQTFAQFFYSTPYYFIMSYVGYQLLKNTTGLPSYLGGTGECINMFINTPENKEATFYMKHFYLMQFGEHFRGLVKHSFFKSDAKYFQFVLHHSLAVFLILFSYMTNYWLAGIMIMVLHDFSDALFKMVRFYIDYRYRNETVNNIISVVFLIVWIICRHVLLTTCCIIPIVQSLSHLYHKFNAVEFDVLFASTSFMTVMLIALACMHVYWTSIFLKFLFMKETKKVHIVS